MSNKPERLLPSHVQKDGVDYMYFTATIQTIERLGGTILYLRAQYENISEDVEVTITATGRGTTDKEAAKAAIAAFKNNGYEPIKG